MQRLMQVAGEMNQQHQCLDARGLRRGLVHELSNLTLDLRR